MKVKVHRAVNFATRLFDNARLATRMFGDIGCRVIDSIPHDQPARVCMVMASNLTHCVVCFVGLKGIVVDSSCANKALRRTCSAVLVSASVMAVWASIALRGNAFTTQVPIGLNNALWTDVHILLMQWHLLKHMLRAARRCCDRHCCCCLFMNDSSRGFIICTNVIKVVLLQRRSNGSVRETYACHHVGPPVHA